MTTALVYARKSQQSFKGLVVALVALAAVIAAVIVFSLTSSNGAARTPATKSSTQQVTNSRPMPVRADGCQYAASFKRC
jgi:hypothetical protein